MAKKPAEPMKTNNADPLKAAGATPAAPKAQAAPAAKAAKPQPAPAPTSMRAPDPTMAAATQVTEQMIAERAYHKWRNGEAGDHASHWHDSERELRGGNG